MIYLQKINKYILSSNTHYHFKWLLFWTVFSLTSISFVKGLTFLIEWCILDYRNFIDDMFYYLVFGIWYLVCIVFVY